MTRKISKAVRRKPKIPTILTSQLPQLYNKLLAEFVALLETESINPYDLSLKARFKDYFDIKGQTEYAASPYITNFLKTPDALAQELPRAKDILKKLDKFDNETIRALTRLNDMNLVRLRNRTKKEKTTQRVSALAIVGSILGLLLDFQDLIAISIKETITGFGGLNISLAVTLFIILIIAIAVRALLFSVNRMITIPRIGLVDALGDILNIAMAHRNLH